MMDALLTGLTIFNKFVKNKELIGLLNDAVFFLPVISLILPG